MPKKKNKVLTKAEQKLAKYKRDLLTSSTAVELAPDITNLLSGLFDDGGLITERAQPIAEPYRPRSPKSKRQREGPVAEPYRPKSPKATRKPKKPVAEPYKPSKEEVERIFKRFLNIKRSAGGSVTVPTKLSRTKKTKIY